MKINADTNILVRAITGDDPVQSKIAKAELKRAEAVVLTIPTLCELVWVLARGYKIRGEDVASAIRRLIDSDNVVVNRPAAEAGLSLLAAGGDFADGAIAYEGRWLGSVMFVSFDQAAVALLRAHSQPARSAEA